MKKGKEWFKRELVKNYPSQSEIDNPDYEVIAKVEIIDKALNLIDKLEEPKKVVVPQFVAEVIKTEKDKNTLGNIAEEIYNDNSGRSWSQLSKAVRWMRLNFTAFADAWINGYTIELEPFWIVKFKAVDFYPLVDEIGYFSKFVGDDKLKIKPTGETELNSKEVYKFTEKEKAEAVALLINGTVERIEVTE